MLAIVSTSDDMELKVWIYSPEDQQFHSLVSIEQAHEREFLSLRVQYCENHLLTKLGSNCKCNNLIFTAENGLIKIWDWVDKKCLNEIKT